MKYLWIMEHKSANLLFFHNYESHLERSRPPQNINEYLISGLLSAINSFSENQLNEQGIEAIDMGQLRWVYMKSVPNNLLLVAAGDKSENPALMAARLEIIKKMFIATFNITPQYWENGAVDINQFSSFAQTVEILQTQWAQAAKIMDIGVIFDLMGIYQQIFIRLIDIVNTRFQGLQYKVVLTALSEYKPEMKKWLIMHKVPEHYRIMEVFIPTISADFDKIIFNQIAGTDVFGLNPVGLDMNIIRPVFSIVLRRFKTVLEDTLGESGWLKLFRYEIRPILTAKWDLLEKMNVIKELFNVFLD
jgi:hypothetical protein